MSDTRVIDVSSLPSYGFSHRSLMWWGTMGLIAIEGSVFGLLIMSYLYLLGRSDAWPPDASPPRLLWGSANLAVLLASVIPNHAAKQAAERLDLSRARQWLIVSILFGLAFIAIRFVEFQALNVRWDRNAYGSIVWVLLGFHTTHILTDVADSIVLAVLLFTGPLEERRFVDVSENALYWDFVVTAWIPIYVVLYLLPRFW